MPLSTESMPDKPAEKKPEKVYRTKDGKKPSLIDKLMQEEKKGMKCETYRNDNKKPVGVRLDSFDRREWVWLNPGEEARIPCADIKEDHNLTLIRE